MVNERMLGLGTKRSVIRELFEFGKKREKEVGKENVFDFSLGNPSVAPPACVNEAIVRLLATENSVAIHGYTSAAGDPALRKKIAEDLNRRFSVGLTENNIYMTCGAAASLTISLAALFHAGDECIAFAPYFTEYRVFTESAGGTLVPVLPEPKTFQPDLTDFEKKITPRTRAVIVNSPNNPSGVVYTEDTVRRIAAILTEKEKEYGTTIYLIADEPYRELVFDDLTVPYTMNYYNDTVVCYSFSKSLSLPGERIGYIAVSPKAKDAGDVYAAVCGAGRALGYVCAPSLMQRVIGEVLGAAVDVGVYRENRDLLLENLTAYGYECVKPDGAFYLFVRAFEPDANAFSERAKQHGLLLVPCDDFGVAGYVRIAYCVEKERILRALPAFKALASEYGKV